jgi:hypothetical protein
MRLGMEFSHCVIRSELKKFLILEHVIFQILKLECSAYTRFV